MDRKLQPMLPVVPVAPWDIIQEEFAARGWKHVIHILDETFVMRCKLGKMNGWDINAIAEILGTSAEMWANLDKACTEWRMAHGGKP
jgi:hypothetical protein